MPSDDLVLPLSALDSTSLPIAGGKAANLGEMTRAGFPVPPGFCVTTAAYARAAAGCGGALSPILEELAAAPPDDVARLGALAARAREALMSAAVPPEIGEAVRAAYLGLGDAAPVAVRSSATAEDLPGASFAGQQDTYLNVLGAGPALDAVRRCWASLFTERAVIYRARGGIDPRAVQLAVVVQRLVAAEVAGVMFTADPVTGRRRRAVIDASPGLGEAVVSGAVNPDHFEVDRVSLKIVSRRLGDKRFSLHPASGGGTSRQERVGGGEACLSDEELRELVRLGTRVEAHYGAPQDTEWALDGDRRIWLLQARPITTLFPLPAGAPEGDDELRVYFNFNVAQGVLRPFTPMGLHSWRMFLAGVLERTRLMAVDPEAGPPFACEAAGRLMMDVTGLLRSDLGRRLVQAILPRMEARSAPLVQQLLADPRLSLRRTSRWALLRKALPALWRTRAPLSFLRALLLPAAARRWCQRSGDELLRRAELPAGATPEQRLETTARLFREGPLWTFLRAGPTFAVGMVGLVLARRLLGAACTPTELDTVLRALPHNPTTEMDLALWALAARLREDPAARQVLTGSSPAALEAAYHAGSLPAPVQAGVKRFLDEYGFRGVAEIDVGVERWRDAPAHILGSLGNYLALGADLPSPAEQFRRGAQEAEAMVEELSLRARSRGLLRGRLVRLALRRTRQLAGVREAPKFQIVRALGRARELLMDVGAHLSREGRLAAPEDIFFLTIPEARAALSGTDPRALVASRRAVYDQELRRRRLPRVLLSDGTEPEPPPPPAGAGLTGTPASAGSVTGTARVILEPNGARLSPGEILVAPSTDPGWTPLFLTAGGLVMEMGGAMSHGAVVAREYGIPAVVGVAHATERIQTGQRITVDGTGGTITPA